MSKTYIIERGKHRSGIFLSPHIGKKHQSKKVIFSNRCWYKKLNEDSYDINKLFGFSHGFHHHDSIRLGWIPDFNNENEIEIWSYIYNKRQRKFQKICNIECRQLIDCRIEIINNVVEFTVSDMSDRIIGQLSVEYILPKIRFGYNLFPYFGGDNTSPQKMDIIII